MSWHATPEVLATFASRPEVLDDPTASSVEQHLLACEACRAAIAAAATPDELERSWDAIADVIDQPRPSTLERLLIHIGVADDTARLVGATGSLQLAWLATVVLLSVMAVVVSAAHGTDTFFLVVAPLLPLGATALAFLPPTDPSGEAGIATTMHGAGVAVRRVLATVVPTLLVLGALTPALPEGSGPGVAWLLPSLALASVSLLLATKLRVAVAVALGAAVWAAVLASTEAIEGVQGRFEESAAFGPAGELVAGAVLVLALSGLVVRRDRFATMEVEW